MVRNPFVFLLDEPLSNLDTKLRNQMRTEIVQLHQRLGKTFVYVTHDQIEAMTMGDRIVVMKDGFIKQVDKPQNVYDKPYNLFVAGFIGAPQMNFIDVLVSEKNGDYCVGFHSYLFKLPRGKVDAQSFQEYVGKIVVMGIRPENLNLADTFASDNIFEAKVVIAEMLGQEIQLLLDCGDVKFKTKVPPDKNAPPKKGIALFFSILFREYKNLIVVNLIFILFSLPVITIGPAFAGMIHVIFKIIRDRPVFPFSDFIDGFKKIFGSPSYTPCCLLLHWAWLLSLWYYLSLTSPPPFLYIPMALSVGLLMMLVIASFYCMIMIVTIKLPLTKIIKNSFLLSVACFPRSMLMFAIMSSTLLLIALFFPVSLLLLLVGYFSIVNFIICYNALKCLDKYIAVQPKDEKTKTVNEE